MTAIRRLAAILAADVNVREHRDGASENRANGSSSKAVTKRNHAWGRARRRRAREAKEGL
jgi:hypothetical protein